MLLSLCKNSGSGQCSSLSNSNGKGLGATLDNILGHSYLNLRYLQAT